MCAYLSFGFYAQVDTYGTQQPIALMKLLIERGGLYDRGKDLNWKTLRNVQFVASMAPPGNKAVVIVKNVSKITTCGNL